MEGKVVYILQPFQLEMEEGWGPEENEVRHRAQAVYEEVAPDFSGPSMALLGQLFCASWTFRGGRLSLAPWDLCHEGQVLRAGC